MCLMEYNQKSHDVIDLLYVYPFFYWDIDVTPSETYLRLEVLSNCLLCALIVLLTVICAPTLCIRSVYEVIVSLIKDE